MAGGPAVDGHYSTKVGYVLVFNLIVGTGALSLPKAFQAAGYILSIILLVIACFTSYVCATFNIEGMAVANAAIHRAKLRKGNGLSKKQIDDAYQIDQRVEVSAMARLFVGKYGVLLLSLVMTVYLFGDLAIYSATVPKSIMNVICGSVNASNVQPHHSCREGWPKWLDRFAVYRLVVCGFVLAVTPLAVAGVQRTKYLQISTSVCRWTAFTLMIVLSCIQLAQKGVPKLPKAVDLTGFGSLFGTTVYAFMCHHSLPSLITPMNSKSHISLFMGLVYTMVLMFYLSLSITGAFAYEHIFDVYSLNFLHGDNDSVIYKIFNYYLALFPVFTLTTNYPIVANTLVNNFIVLIDLIAEVTVEHTKLPIFGSSVMGCHPDCLTKRYLCANSDKERLLREESESDSEDDDDDMASVAAPPSLRSRKRYVVMSLVIVTATAIAIGTDNVLLLSSITGSYPGVGVQYIIPSLIALFGRRYSIRKLDHEVPRSASSPFSHNIWPYLMFGWSIFTIIMVTLNFCNVFD